MTRCDCAPAECEELGVFQQQRAAKLVPRQQRENGAKHLSKEDDAHTRQSEQVKRVKCRSLQELMTYHEDDDPEQRRHGHIRAELHRLPRLVFIRNECSKK